MVNKYQGLHNLINRMVCLTSKLMRLFHTSGIIAFVVFASLLVSNPANAQNGPPPPPGRPGGSPGNGNGKGPPCWPKPCDPANIPIDNGISFLIAAGILYGARKTYQLNKNKMA